MLKRFFRLVSLLVICMVLAFSNPDPAAARWFIRDQTAVDPVKVCQDGIYLGVGATLFDNEDPFIVPVVAITLPAGEILFDRNFEIPYNPVHEENFDLTHSKYFTETWDSDFIPVQPGTAVALPKGVGLETPVVTVQDCLLSPQEPMAGSAFTYQGNLSENGNPANGSYDLQFKLYNALTAGSQISSTLTINNLTVSDGVFSTELDFGSDVFTGSARWLEVSVRPGGSSGAFTMLSPRQPLQPVPYALSVLNVPDHDHLGQTWIGNYNPLTIEGSYYSTPLTLKNNVGGGLLITSVYDGVQITSQQGDGLNATTNSTFGDGVVGRAITTTGTTRGVYGLSSSKSGTGVYGYANSSGGATYGVYGKSTSVSGTGVFGEVDSSSGTTYGVYGKSSSGSGTGVYGEADSSTGSNYGVYGVTSSSLGTGVYGEHSSTSGLFPGIKGVTKSTSTQARGVWGDSPYGMGVLGYSDSGIGTYGYANSSTGTNYGIVGWTNSASGYAGYFVGDVYVTGDLSALGAKPFKIDNPLDPANQYLYHYAMESPQIENVYNGVVTLDADGVAVVQLPAYFEALNKGEFTYQLTPIGASMPELYISQEINGNTFQISGGVADMKVSWSVTGVRNDPYIQATQHPVEAPKLDTEKGTYLFPQGYGQPESQGLENKLPDPHQSGTP